MGHQIVDLLPQYYLKEITDCLLKNTYVFFNPQSLKRILEENKLKVIKSEYPFFKTDYFSKRNILRLFKIWDLSPPFYGNLMTFYVKKI